MRATHRRRRERLIFLTALLLLGLIFYGQRCMGLLRSLFPSFSVFIEPLKPAGALRAPAQQMPGPGGPGLELARWSFDRPDSLKNWEEKIFKGSTDFHIRSEGKEGYLHSESRDACSGLFVRMHEEAVPDLWIDWKWRAFAFPVKKNPQILSNRQEDDFAARLYVIFLGHNLFRSDAIEYIWDESLPAGMTADSPYSDRIKLLVVRSGPNGGEGSWQEEHRNVYEDYRKLFGREPRYALGMIALMSDSDNTGSHAVADFGDIVLLRQKSS